MSDVQKTAVQEVLSALTVGEFLESLPEEKRDEWHKFLTSSAPHNPIEWAKPGKAKLDTTNEDILRSSPVSSL
jgi:hypothetical protein